MRKMQDTSEKNRECIHRRVSPLLNLKYNKIFSWEKVKKNVSHWNEQHPHASHLVPSTAASSREERPSRTHRNQARQWSHRNVNSFPFNLLLLCIIAWSWPSEIIVISWSSGSVMLLATSVGLTASPCVFLAITGRVKAGGRTVSCERKRREGEEIF